MASHSSGDRLVLLEQIQADHEELRATLGILQIALADRLTPVARVSPFASRPPLVLKHKGNTRET